MSANGVGWVFTGGDDTTGVHGDRFVGVAANPHARPPLSDPEGRPNQKAEQEIKRCAGTPRVHRLPAHASLRITVDTVISTFLADALPRSAA